MSNLTPPPHLSPSSINTFNQCPQKFKFNKLDLIADDPNEAGLMGNFVHDVLEEFYKKPKDERTTQTAKVIAGELWESRWRELVEPWVKGEESIRMFRWNSWWCIENLWSVEDPLLVEPTGLEHELNGDIMGVRIKGFIDRFSIREDGGITISDYKTGKTPKKHYTDDKFFQLLVYAWLLNEGSLFTVDTIELLYLKEGVRLWSPVNEENLQGMANIVVQTKIEVDKACETGDFPTRKSVLCDWCSYKEICPAWRKK